MTIWFIDESESKKLEEERERLRRDQLLERDAILQGIF